MSPNRLEVFARTTQWIRSHPQTAFVIVVLLCCTLGTANAWPHMYEPLWQDEASTLVTHASGGMVHPFLNYFSPNNHIGFTAMLAGWLELLPKPPEPFLIRLLPFALFLLSIPATVLAAWRLAGPVSGLLAGLFFAGSSVTANFATQIRGYAPSWIFMALALVFGLQALRARNAVRWTACFFLVSAVCVAILPTNMLLVGVIAVALVLSDWATHRRPEPGKRLVYLALLGAPVLGLLLVYAGVWHELLSFGQGNLSEWSRGSLLASWLTGTFWDWPWMAPLVGAGIGLRLGPWSTAARQVEVSRLVFSLSLAVGLVAVIVCMPRTPFPRTLVPLLPAWYVALGTTCALLVEQRNIRQQFPWLAGGLLALSIPLALDPKISRCGQARPGAGAFESDLCYQYFRDRYHPDQIVAAWAARGEPDVAIVTDFEGAFALQALHSPARIYPYRYIPVRLYVAPMIVAHDDSAASTIAAYLGAPPGAYVGIADTGYFKLYAVGKP